MAPSDNPQTITSRGDDEEHVDAVDRTPSAWRSTWENNKGMFLILIANLFGSSMDAIARALQQSGHRFNTFEIVVARMSTTFILSTAYMWWTNVPYFPLGNPKIRGWLILRSIFGFGGLLCLYYSLHYLPLAESTVFRFLVPIVTAWACSVFLGQHFTRSEFIAGLLALAGVVIIAHPESIFGKVDDAIEADSVPRTDVTLNQAAPVDEVSPTQRLVAITVSVMGIFGASGAYTTIRIIGDRAHALMSVNYFAFLSTVGSIIALLVVPGAGFRMPDGPTEWTLLLVLGLQGFALQFLLTAGLQLDKSPKATSMLYTQVLFALAFDWAIWGVLPGSWSLFGGAIVIASTLWSALQKTPASSPKGATQPSVVDEEAPLLGARLEGGEEARRASMTSV